MITFFETFLFLLYHFTEYFQPFFDFYFISKLIDLIFFSFSVFVNSQGHLIDTSPMNKPGKYNIRIDGFLFGKWTNTKHIFYWRCSRAQAIGFVVWIITIKFSIGIHLVLSSSMCDSRSKHANVHNVHKHT